ncbi:MAG: Asp23/Gls24 family envelope stress response protein [Clostridiales bacterium]|nr:Asp23/Gls24 family envelope stress response protein [Clostridiales bacterium]
MSIQLERPGGGLGALPGADVDADVVAQVAARAALEVDGVLAVENALTDGIASALGREGRARGVRVFIEHEGCGFHISVVTRYGERIPEVAWNLQEHIKNTVEDYVGVRVQSVNILIAGIRES